MWVAPPACHGTSCLTDLVQVTKSGVSSGRVGTMSEVAGNMVANKDLSQAATISKGVASQTAGSVLEKIGLKSKTESK